MPPKKSDKKKVCTMSKLLYIYKDFLTISVIRFSQKISSSKIPSYCIFERYCSIKIDDISFFRLLASANIIIVWDATLLPLILHLNFFKHFAFFKFNMLDKKTVLITLKIKIICLTKELS